MSRRNIVLDTSVLKFAESAWKQPGRSGSKEEKAAHLLFKIIDVCHKIVLDHDELILKEYQNKVEGNPLLVKIMQSLSTHEYRDKFVWRPRAEITIPGFDKEDHKFIQVAVNLPDGSLVIAGEDDFFGNEISKFAEDRKITIVSIEEALELL